MTFVGPSGERAKGLLFLSLGRNSVNAGAFEPSFGIASPDMLLIMDGMEEVTLTTDGACASPGGWAYILRYGRRPFVNLAGGVSPQRRPTIGWKFRPQLKPAKALKQPCKVLLVTDSTICLRINMTDTLGEKKWLGYSPKNNKAVLNGQICGKS